jgi:hypothetical protein
MTSDVEDILAAARSLPPQEQLEVLCGLAESLAGASSALEAAAAGFWVPRSLDELAAERHIPIIVDIGALALPDWPDDESVDDLLAYVREQRRADRKA